MGFGWREARQRLSNAVTRNKKTQALAMKRMALRLEAEIKKGLKSGKPGGKRLRPLSPMTLALRRGSKPLLDNGALLGSIKTTFDENTATAFVGVHRSVRSSDGESVVNIALTHEFGTKPFSIRVTPKMRALFIALFLKTGGAIRPIGAAKTVITHPGIPARPFIRPTVEKLGPELERVGAKVITERGVI